MSRRSALGRVLGLGSARDGTGHWWSQRLSAMALIPLTLWFAVAMLGLIGSGADQAAVRAWIAAPLNTVLLLLLLVVSMQHARLGLQVIIEDYVHADGLKVMSLVLMSFLLVLLGVAGVVAVLRIAFGGAGL